MEEKIKKVQSFWDASSVQNVIEKSGADASFFQHYFGAGSPEAIIAQIDSAGLNAEGIIELPNIEPENAEKIEFGERKITSVTAVNASTAVGFKDEQFVSHDSDGRLAKIEDDSTKHIDRGNHLRLGNLRDIREASTYHDYPVAVTFRASDEAALCIRPQVAGTTRNRDIINPDLYLAEWAFLFPSKPVFCDEENLAKDLFSHGIKVFNVLDNLETIEWAIKNKRPLAECVCLLKSSTFSIPLH